jgi:hypothetical protein
MLREPTMPTMQWLQCKAMRLKLFGIFRMSYSLDMSKGLKYLNDSSKILKHFSLDIFTFSPSAFTERKKNLAYQ